MYYSTACDLKDKILTMKILMCGFKTARFADIFVFERKELPQFSSRSVMVSTQRKWLWLWEA